MHGENSEINGNNDLRTLFITRYIINKYIEEEFCFSETHGVTKPSGCSCLYSGSRYDTFKPHRSELNSLHTLKPHFFKTPFNVTP